MGSYFTYLNAEFEAKAKNSSEEALERRRKTLAKYKIRSFTANLSKRFEASAIQRSNGEVVALKNDGTNDAPALLEADIDLAMGIEGTEVAKTKESADVIILDNFLTIVTVVVMCGRSVYVNIQKFVQYVVALMVNFSSACLTGSAPLTAVQLLWVNKPLPNHTTYKKHPPLSLRPNTKTHTKKTHTHLMSHHKSHNFLCLILLLITAVKADDGALTTDASGGSNGSKKGSSGLTGMVIGIVLGVIVFVVILLFFSYKLYVKKRNQNRVTFEDSEICNYPIVFLRQVTNNFNENNILGRGGFGVVYKGELCHGTKIAVKRMTAGVMGTKGLKEFQAEIVVLRKVRHRHLVALLGYCVNGNERLLVYEYMPQGTLSQRLFEFRELNINPLSWKQRVSIALDVGRGMEYLHSLAQQSFIHRDLKPSNILLDNDLRAKVADFGLVKIAPHWDELSVETKLAGTFGYLAPEYANTGRVTTKVDVYAFGVVLMQLITGRKPLEMPDNRNLLVAWFCSVLISRENIRKALDQTLPNVDEENLDNICKVVELARHCTEGNPHHRPDMSHAVNVLRPLVEQWVPSGAEEDDGNGINLNRSLSQLVGRLEGDEGSSTMYYSFGQTQSEIGNS